MLAATEITLKNVDPQQRWLMRLLPVGFTIFLLSFPAGLFVYWITSNLFTLGQNYLIYHHGPGKRPAPDAKNSAGTTTPQTPISNGSTNVNGSTGVGARSGEGSGDAAAHAAKVAKRKRRKKKK
jgi:YidC/Oxa1 family membrane protein insertase